MMRKANSNVGDANEMQKIKECRDNIFLIYKITMLMNVMREK